MNNKLKKNLPLYIGLAIPVLMIIVIIVAVYLPRLSAPKPKYNFVYTTQNGYYPNYSYQVSNKHLIKNLIPTPTNQYSPNVNTTEPTLFLYNISTNTTQEIPFQEAQALTLDPAGESLDGYSVSQAGYGGGFPFGGGSRDYNARYLTGHGVSKKLNLRLGSNNNYYQFQFLGWVE